MIKPSKVMILIGDYPYEGSDILAVDIEEYRAGKRPYRASSGESSYGACCTYWRKLTDEQIFHALTWLAMEIVEFQPRERNISIKDVRDCLEEYVEGYKEYSDRIGMFAIGGVFF